MNWILPVFGASFLLNVVLAFFVFRPRKTKRKLDTNAQDLLHDLTRRGAAILKIEVIDAANLMLRSPRG